MSDFLILSNKGISINRFTSSVLSRFIITFDENNDIFMGFDIDLEKNSLVISFKTNKYIKKYITLDDELSIREIINTIQEIKMTMQQFNLEIKNNNLKVLEDDEE